MSIQGYLATIELLNNKIRVMEEQHSMQIK